MAGIDFDKLKNIVDDKFETVRVLDNDGNVVNKDLFPDLSDEQIVELKEIAAKNGIGGIVKDV